jgi:hypothetical protein
VLIVESATAVLKYANKITRVVTVLKTVPWMAANCAMKDKEKIYYDYGYGVSNNDDDIDADCYSRMQVVDSHSYPQHISPRCIRCQCFR